VNIAVCVDVGSTFTKAAAVDLDGRGLLATAEHRTTSDTDVLHGLDAAAADAMAGIDATAGIDAGPAETLVCSSAGGGLRLAVVGYEPLVTAEAGRRVGLSAGARVVHVAAGPLDRAGLAELRATRPDVLLLAGGTDGGEADVLRHNARRLAAARIRRPVVVAGNAEVRDEVVSTLTGAGVPTVATDNVLPRIGDLNPGPARSAIREVFLRHVIGGRGLSRGRRFGSLVRGPTPDVVLTAVELLAGRADIDLVVVDVGGATTDVYSAVRPDGDGAARRDVAGTLWCARTVEGDLGVRASAVGVVAAATGERLLDADERDELMAAATARGDDPAYLPTTPRQWALEARLGRLAATVALRRHARPGPDTAGRDLSRVRVLIGSGGVFRYANNAGKILTDVLADHAGGWALPRSASVVVDRDYVLAPAGLLAAEHETTALGLMRRLASIPKTLARDGGDGHH
jgi:uncharacterized protein (TIGR01319 family)